MKKILFIVFAIAGLTNLASAQQGKVSPTMDPPPSKAESEKAAQSKASAYGMSANPVSSPKPATSSANSTAAYKKAGLTDIQINQLNNSMADMDKKRAELENNTQLTPEQRKSGLSAVEAERSAILRKSMGEEKYKSYSAEQLQSQGKAKPSKSNTKD